MNAVSLFPCSCLFHTHSWGFRAEINSYSQQSEDKDGWRRERRCFHFPHSQNVLSQFWGRFHMGIQRCSTLLIRLLCQVLLHLSQAYCSTGRQWGGKDVGIIKHSTLTSCTASFEDGQPNTLYKRNTNTADMPKKLTLIVPETICCPHKDGEQSVTPNSAPKRNPANSCGGLLKRCANLLRDRIMSP